MLSFQRLLGRQEEFFSLLRASAEQSIAAVAALKHVTTNPAARSLDAFVEARREDKRITEKLEEMLAHTFITPIEREDIEELAEVLYKIPKTVEKFAERYLLSHAHTHAVDFTGQLELLEKAVSLVRDMVVALHAGDLRAIKEQLNAVQQIEGEADDVLTRYIAALYEPGYPALKAIILKELYDLAEKAIDRCRDAGSVISHVLLKNS